jgi:hypothetical protein
MVAPASPRRGFYLACVILGGNEKCEHVVKRFIIKISRTALAHGRALRPGSVSRLYTPPRPQDDIRDMVRSLHWD